MQQQQCLVPKTQETFRRERSDHWNHWLGFWFVCYLQDSFINGSSSFKLLIWEQSCCPHTRRISYYHRNRSWVSLSCFSSPSLTLQIFSMLMFGWTTGRVWLTPNKIFTELLCWWASNTMASLGVRLGLNFPLQGVLKWIPYQNCTAMVLNTLPSLKLPAAGKTGLNQMGTKTLAF